MLNLLLTDFAHNATEIWMKKTKDILWLVSNCNSDTSKRMEFVKTLQRETGLTVDIYGACGNQGKVLKENQESLLQEYKFYLAFEVSRKKTLHFMGRLCTVALNGIPGINRGFYYYLLFG